MKKFLKGLLAPSGDSKIRRRPTLDIDVQETKSVLNALVKFFSDISDDAEFTEYMSNDSEFNPINFAYLIKKSLPYFDEWKLEENVLSGIGNDLNDALGEEVILEKDPGFQSCVANIIKLISSKEELNQWYSRFGNSERPQYKMSPEVFNILAEIRLYKMRLENQIKVLGVSFSGLIDDKIDSSSNLVPSNKLKMKAGIKLEREKSKAVFEDLIKELRPVNGSMILSFSINIFDVRITDLLKLKKEGSKKIDLVRSANKLIATTESILENPIIETFERAASSDFSFYDEGMVVNYSMTMLAYYVMVEATYSTIAKIFSHDELN